MKKILILAVIILAIGTASLAGCKSEKATHSNTAPETQQTVQETQEDNNRDLKQPELDEGITDEDRIPEVKQPNHIKRHRNHKQHGNPRPMPKPMPHIQK